MIRDKANPSNILLLSCLLVTYIPIANAQNSASDEPMDLSLYGKRPLMRVLPLLRLI